MTQVIYDLCLIYTSNVSLNFGVVRLQTDDTLELADKTFTKAENI